MFLFKPIASTALSAIAQQSLNELLSGVVHEEPATYVVMQFPFAIYHY